MNRLLTLLALSFLLLLPACAGDDERTVVRLMVSGDPAERDAYLALVAAFHTRHPGIAIDVTHIPSPRDYRTRLATEFAAGNPPDITLMNYRRYAAFAAREQLVPLGPYLDRSGSLTRNAFFPVTLAAFTWRDELMCLPQNISSLVVYYNRDLFAAGGVPEPRDGWRWEEFLATAQALTQDRDGDGRPNQFGLGVEPSLFRLAPFVWQNGGVIVDSTDRPTRLTLTRFPSQAALAWFVALQTVHGVTPNRVEEAAQDSESRFLAGTTAMYLNSRRGTPAYRAIEAFAWDVAPLPRGAEAAGVLHSDAYCLSAASTARDAAWTFIEFANSVEGQTIIAGTGRTVPSLIAVANSPAFLNPGQPPGRSQVWLDQVDSLRLVPVLSTWQEIEDIASEEIERAFYGDIPAADAARLADQRTEEYFLLGVGP